MTVSKTTRFEVLRRDGHTCRYCGGKAPDVSLTVDHVTPIALGGSDDPANLVAACWDCNAGKGSTSPDAEIVAQVGEDDMRWAAAVKRAAGVALDDYKQQRERHAWFYPAWKSWDDSFSYLPDGAERSLDHWLGAGLPQELILDALDIALGNRNLKHESVFAYMGGICRKKIDQLHTDARALLNEEPADGP